jgi:formate dehydrogenase major subunit
MRNTIFKLPIFSVIIDTEFPKESPYPDIILPGANFAESDGTYTNCERRIQHLHRAIVPPAGKQNWEVISALATSLGYPMHYPEVASIYQEIVELVPFYKIDRGSKSAGGTAQWPLSGIGKFSFGSGLTQPNLPDFHSSEIISVLGSLA